MKVIIKYTIILVFIITFFLYITYRIKKTKDDERNIRNKKEKMNRVMENFISNINYNNNNIYYVYWTGGYDSTFRLCEMLIVENKIVQPIYVSLVLDNDCKTEESCNKLWLRRNRKEERKAMNEIINKLHSKFPKTVRTLLPLIEIDEEINDDLFNFQFEKKFYRNNLFPRKRRKHQYLFLSKYAYYNKTPIDIGVLGIHQKSKFANFLKYNLKRTTDNFVVPLIGHPLSYINFPLYGRTKEILLEQAKENDFDDILQLTWSCWFPKNGKPCGKCPMCKERIISHPDNK